MKAFISLLCLLLVFSLTVLPPVLCDFSVTEAANAPPIAVTHQSGAHPLSVTLSPAAIAQSPVLEGMEKGAAFLPFFIKDGVAALAKETGNLLLSLLSLLS